MTAARFKIKLEQGATYRRPFKWKSGGVLVDMTGYTGRMHIRPDIDSSNIIATLTTENGGITIFPSGTFTLFISDADTALLDFEEAVYDIELIAPNGDVTRILEGIATLSREVTR